MSLIPDKETDITDQQVFEAFNLNLPQLAKVKSAWTAGDLPAAKKALVTYFETRENVNYLFDYRSLPLRKMEPDQLPYAYQSALGLRGSLKEFCLKSGKSMLKHRYLLPGGRKCEDLGENFEHMIHFNFFEDQEKRHRHSLDMFVRGQFFEALCVLYHEEEDSQVLTAFADILNQFFKTYPLIVEDASPSANRFQYTEDRDVMSAGWLVLVFISLFYTRLPYEIPAETSFEIIKHIWFLGIQFKRFETDGYRPYNHHMWERGLVPYLLSILIPEITDFSSYKERGAQITCRHIKEDFNKEGGYSEHSIAYWSGAAIGEMLFRGVYLSKLNNETLLDKESGNRIFSAFSLLSLLAPPGPVYPSLGDNGGPLILPILNLGEKMMDHPMCREHSTAKTSVSETRLSVLPLDYCSQKTGFLCGRSGYGSEANYLLMSVKTGCGCSGHNHMDLLSLFLTIRGRSIIGEPYADKLYHTIRMNSPQRGYMYNMTSHNTVLVHGQPLLPDEIYANKWGVYRPDTPVLSWYPGADGFYAKAFHDAYTYCRHSRSLLFHRDNGVVIRDEIERGNRMQAPHIQRFHLEADTHCRILNDFAVLVEKDGVRVLFVWSGNSEIRIWKNTALCPEIYENEDQLSPILDVSFEDFKDRTVDIGTVSLNLLILDITGCPGDFTDQISSLTKESLLHSLREQLETMIPIMNEADALNHFPKIRQLKMNEKECEEFKYDL